MYMMDTPELRNLVYKLSTQQLEVLVKRFSGADSNAEACRAMSPQVADSSFSNWLKKPAFKQLYDIMAVDGAETIKRLIPILYDSAAAKALLEQIKLIETENSKLDSRAIASKFTSIGDILDRAVPRKSQIEHIYTWRLEEIAPPRHGEIIEGEVKVLDKAQGPQDADAHEDNGQEGVSQEEEVNACKK